MSDLVARLLDVPAPVAYVVVFLLVFGEAAVFVGFVLPGETAVVLGGVLAATGRLHLGVLLLLVVVAAVLGDSAGYEVGKVYGPRVLQLRMLQRQSHRIEGAREFLRDRGGSAVLLGRFTAFLRAVMPGLAGLSGMPYRRFLLWNALGGLVWGVGFTLVGYFAGSSLDKLEKAVGRGSVVITVVLVVVLVLLHRRSRERSGS